MAEYLSVSILTKYLKLKFDKDPYLERGLFDRRSFPLFANVRTSVLSSKTKRLSFRQQIRGGVYKKPGFDSGRRHVKINVVGRIQLYEPSGSYSIIIEKKEPDGVGALAIQFEQLKNG